VYVTPFSSRGEVKKYCHFVQSEIYEACQEKDLYTYIYYFKSWITLKLYVRTKIMKRLFEI